ncbi:hypothetical protein D8I24_0252 (plasmid) [Cupriavidus necator H850]|nr:hypothetical protein D8I24_0252 [Cupriavidus necator H850]
MWRIDPSFTESMPYGCSSSRCIWSLPCRRNSAVLCALLDEMRRVSQNFGYGVADAMDALLAEPRVDG